MDANTTTAQEKPQEIKPGMQVCNAHILFAVNNDDEALAIKRKLGEAIAGLANVRLQFSMTTLPTRPIPEM